MPPEKGTPEYEVLLTAIEIAAAAPRRKGSYSYSATIPWHMILKLREQLTGMNINWESLKPQKEKVTYARHVPTDQHLYDDPDEPLLCSCGMPLRFYRGTGGSSKRGWACSNLPGPTAAFADIPEPEGR